MWFLTNLYSCNHTCLSFPWLVHVVHVYTSTGLSPYLPFGKDTTGQVGRPCQLVLIHGTRGGWSYYYKHGTAPITQYMAASTQFNPLCQQIIFTYKQNYTYSRHQECALDNNSITWPTSSGMGLCCPVLSHKGKDMAGGAMLLACDCTYQEYIRESTYPVYCCINGIFCKLRHDSAINIILRPGLSSW